MFASFALLLLAGCEVADSGTRAVPDSAATPSSSSAPASETAEPLPFENQFPDRRNPANDGTEYEPCTAFSHVELAKFGVDPAVVEDIAQVNGQGTRGCYWFMPNAFALGQLVTNSNSLVEYKSALKVLEWKPDITIGGRAVGIFDLKDDTGSCSTYVQSHAAAVITEVSVSTSPSARSAIDPCKLVEDFTRAYIDKIPN